MRHLYPAIIPGDDVVLLPIVEARICSKCGWKYCEWGEHPKFYKKDWCPPCNADITRDPYEQMRWSRYKEIEVYAFMGWKFHIVPMLDTCYLRCFKLLLNPEAPELTLSVYSCGNPNPTYFDMAKGGAWLIAHWWEHALDICPCQHGVHDDEKGSQFRQTMIESLMMYHHDSLRGEECQRQYSSYPMPPRPLAD